MDVGKRYIQRWSGGTRWILAECTEEFARGAWILVVIDTSVGMFYSVGDDIMCFDERDWELYGEPSQSYSPVDRCMCDSQSLLWNGCTCGFAKKKTP